MKNEDCKTCEKSLRLSLFDKAMELAKIEMGAALEYGYPIKKDVADIALDFYDKIAGRLVK